VPCCSATRRDDGKLIYAGRVGTGMHDKVLADLRHSPEPLAREAAPPHVLPPRKSRFGSPLVLSRVHRVCLRDNVADVDRRQPLATNGLRRTEGRQAG
jgi:ATP-dependent DNA ligase